MELRRGLLSRLPSSTITPSLLSSLLTTLAPLTSKLPWDVRLLPPSCHPPPSSPSSSNSTALLLAVAKVHAGFLEELKESPLSVMAR